MIKRLHNLHSFVLSQKRQFFANFLAKIFKNRSQISVLVYFGHFFKITLVTKIFKNIYFSQKWAYVNFDKNMGRVTFPATFPQSHLVTLSRSVNSFFLPDLFSH
jgi:hypothetical protein